MRVSIGVLLAVISLVAACGGGDNNGPFLGIGGPGPGSGGGSPPPPVSMNTVPVLVDGGPVAAGGTVNTLYTSVTICMPGSTTACQTIDHVQVDTTSTGFRVLASALGNSLLAQLVQANDGFGNPLDECVQFANGYSWGTVRAADLQIGSETAAGSVIQVIGDSAAPPAPASCVSGPEENTPQSFGANGVLGIGYFLSDCGIACESSPVAGTYYGCPAAGCQPVAIPVVQQLQNPVSLFASDYNGVIVTLPSVISPTAVLNGTLTFGIGTQADNSLGNAQIYTVDANYGTLNTIYNGVLLGSSFIDAGANAYYFTDDTLPICADQPGLYCPAAPQPLNATIQGTNGTAANIAFTVDNADADLATTSTALPNLAGPVGSGAASTFDWGLPFFYGRSVYVAFEAGSPAGVPGPWVGF